MNLPDFLLYSLIVVGIIVNLFIIAVLVQVVIILRNVRQVIRQAEVAAMSAVRIKNKFKFKYFDLIQLFTNFLSKKMT